MAKQNSFMLLSNRMIGLLLRSRFHSLVSGSTLLVQVSGLKSGKTIQTPINYLKIGDSLYATSSRNRTWWRNLRGGQICKIWHKGQEKIVKGFALEAPAEVEPALALFLQASPATARFLGIKISPDGIPDPVGFSRAVDQQVMIRFDYLPDPN